MKFTLHRMDAVYTAAFEPPILALAGGVPEFIRAAYSAFHGRYPFIGVNLFKALPGGSLAEVGIQVGSLEGRLQFDIRVDQMQVRAVNLQRNEEIRFAQDLVLLAQDVVRKFSPDGGLGACTLKVSAWLTLEGGRAACDGLLARLATPRAAVFDGRKLNATAVAYTPRLRLQNDEDGWQVNVIAEPSAIADADLFVLRDYAFSAGKTLVGGERQFAFIDLSTAAILEWLDLQPPGQ